MLKKKVDIIAFVIIVVVAVVSFRGYFYGNQNFDETEVLFNIAKENKLTVTSTEVRRHIFTPSLVTVLSEDNEKRTFQIRSYLHYIRISEVGGSHVITVSK